MEKPLLSDPETPIPSYDSLKRKSSEEIDTYTSALDKCDIGLYTVMKLLVCGLAYMGAMSTILGVQFALPDVLFDFGITTDTQIISVVIVYSGVSIGAGLFGVCGDVIGRRPVIIFLLSFCAIFNCISSASRSFREFILLITLNCVCAGGTLPALWSYFIEFQMPLIANKSFCLLSLFWAFSYTVSAVIPKLVLDSCYDFPASYGFALWRVRLLISSFLALLPVILFKFSQESPELILASGDPETSLTILQSIHARNRSPNKMTTVLIGEEQSENINLWMDSDSSVRSALSCLRNHLREIPSNLKISTVSLLLITGFGFYCSCYSTFIVLPELYKEIYSVNSSQSMTSLSPLLMPLPIKSITPSYLNETVSETCEKSISNHFFLAGASIQQAIALSSILAAFLWMPQSNGKIIIYACLTLILLLIFLIFGVMFKPFIYLFIAAIIPTVVGTVAYWCLCLSMTLTAYRSTIAGIALSVCSFGTIVGYIIYYYLLIQNVRPLMIPAVIISVGTFFSTRFLKNSVGSDSFPIRH